jgi:hypothetical protein
MSFTPANRDVAVYILICRGEVGTGDDPWVPQCYVGLFTVCT